MTESGTENTKSGTRPDLELIVTDEPVVAAFDIFLEIAPRRLVLGGGETPRSLYQMLSYSGHGWSDTDVFFSDERCVPSDHPDSNYRMAYESLLGRVNALVHPMPGYDCDAETHEQELRALFGHAPLHFDLAILGLGEDGHTASLFPGDAALEERERLVMAVERPDHPRLTLTLPVLSAADTTFFYVTGASKAEAVRALAAGEDIPASRVASQRRILDLRQGGGFANRLADVGWIRGWLCRNVPVCQPAGDC